MIDCRDGPSGGTGRRSGLKIRRPSGHEGSIPFSATSQLIVTSCYQILGKSGILPRTVAQSAFPKTSEKCALCGFLQRRTGAMADAGTPNPLTARSAFPARARRGFPAELLYTARSPGAGSFRQGTYAQYGSSGIGPLSCSARAPRFGVLDEENARRTR